MTPHPGQSHAPIPVRTILATIGLVLVAALALYLVVETRRVLTWMVIATFFAVALYPLTAWIQRRMLGDRWRALATFLVFLAVFLGLGGLVTAFAIPLVREGTKFAGQLPELIDQARAGHGAVGRLLERTNALEWVENNHDRIDSFVNSLTAPAAGVLGSVATGIAGAVTVFVLAYLMVLEGPKVVNGAMRVLPPSTGERILRVGVDCARSVTGYLTGNLLISVICGVLTYVVLLILGIPFAGLIALFVGLADLVPLVGATIGGAVAVIAGFLHSTTAGIAVLVFFVLYQQLENHLLQPLIFARTVKLNPLAVIVAILLGVELVGVLGALLAIPVAGMIQVILRDVWDHRRGRLKAEPTVGPERRPAVPADDDGHPRPEPTTTPPPPDPGETSASPS
ncbi:AI-2E family transporter [Blastococcus litoris]|uniref:AI-2E family transporter n=1 Tax=Blastococcus litoris TaxID=2171622 RepID=UPI000E305F28|nr:AI-2E family transporter [Blastococcus litoris]